MSIRIFTILVLCGLLRPDAYTEEEAKEASSTCSPSLVRDQRWPKEERYSDVELDLDNSESASLTRPTVPGASSCCLQNYSSHGSTGMEMWSLQNYESQKSGILPSLRWPLAHVLRGGQFLELVSEQCSAIITSTKNRKLEETIPKSIRQRTNQREREGRQREQGERQTISSTRRQKCFPFLSGRSVFTAAAIYSSLAGHGLLAVSGGLTTGQCSCEPEPDQPTSPRADPSDQKSFPRSINYACPGQGGIGESGGIRCETNHQGPPCSYVCSWKSKTGLPGSIGGPQTAQEWLDEASGRKSCGLGETIGQLQVQLCSTPGCRVQSPPRCCQRQAQYSAAELPVREQWSRRSSVSGRNGGHTWRQGGREGQTATASNHAELHGLRWCRGEASRNHGDPLRYRKGNQTAKISRTDPCEAGCFVNVGQTPTCQKKDGVAQANSQWFEDVEAYCHCPFADGAACMPKPTVFTAAQACVHRHSVQNEPDFVSELRAALNAFVLSWQVNVMSFGIGNGPGIMCPSVRCGDPTLPTCRIKSIPFFEHRNRQLRFEKVVDLHIFEEHCVRTVPSISFGIDDLKAWNDKPWRLHSLHWQHDKAGSRSQPHVSDRWCVVRDSWPSTPTTDQCRLLDDHLSQAIDRVDIDEPGTCDLDLPQDIFVSFDEEEDFHVLLASASSPEEDTVTLEMFGLLITHHSIRVAASSIDIESIKETIRQTWTDVTPRNSLMNAFLLKPQDRLGDRTIQLLIEIVPPEIRIPVIDVPVLRRSKWYSDDSTSTETAYMRDSQTGYELLIDAGHADWCFSSRNIQCNLHIEGRIAFLSLRHPLRQGAVLSFFIHDDWIAPGVNAQDDPREVPDETSLMDFSTQISSKAVGRLDENSGTTRLGNLKENSVSGTSDPLSCAQEVTQHDLAIREVKPNPGIPPDLDGVVPRRQRAADGHLTIGRTIVPPNWQLNRAYGVAAESGSVFRDDADDLRIRVRSWIASVRTQLILPHRDFTIRAQLMSDLEIRLRRAWRDQIQQTDRIKFTVVRPSPNIGYTGRKPLHVLIELNRPHNSQLHPILIAHREITVRGPANPVQWIPVLVATPIGRTTLHNICSPPCRSDQLLVPMPGRVRRWMSQENGRPIYSGLFLPIWWDARIRPPPNPAYEEDDQQVLLQRASTSDDINKTAEDKSRCNSTSDSQPAGSQISHVFDRWCSSVEEAGPIMETDNSDFTWMMQITDPSDRDLCCQPSLIQKFNEIEAGREGIRICSHGLSGTSVGSRFFVIPAAHLPLLKQAVRSNWPEFMDASGRLHLVHPQPQDTLRPTWRTCVHIVVEFSANEMATPIDAVPVLEESVVWNAYGTANVKHAACYYARRTHFRDIFEKFEHLCVRASFKCIVRVEGHRLYIQTKRQTSPMGHVCNCMLSLKCLPHPRSL